MKKGMNYAILIFLLWICSPLLLSSLKFAVENVIISDSFFYNLFTPALIFSIIAFLISNIKKDSIRIGLFYGLIGAIIWVSPAAYFINDFPESISSNIISRYLVIIIPALILSSLLYYIGKTKQQQNKDITDLYIKHFLITKKNPD